MLRTKQFTNGADAETVIELYRATATALLGSATELSYAKLEWAPSEYERLGEALAHCGALETLELKGMGVEVLHGPLPASLRTLKLLGCKSLVALHGLAGLAALKELDLDGCSSLAALHGLAGLAIYAEPARPAMCARLARAQPPADLASLFLARAQPLLPLRRPRSPASHHAAEPA